MNEPHEEIDRLQVFHDVLDDGEDVLQTDFRATVKRITEQLQAEDPETKLETISMNGMFAGRVNLSYLTRRAQEYSQQHPEMAPDELGALVCDELYSVIQRCKFALFDVNDSTLTINDDDQVVRRYFVKVEFRTRNDLGPYEYTFTFTHDMAGVPEDEAVCRQWPRGGQN